jgi:chemotaxis protein MotB
VSGQSGTKVIIIKKKAKHAGHHGGAWKVAYADFVTAMMALFIVLWLLTQSDEASKERIAQYFRTGMLPGGTLTVGTPAGSSPPVAINIFPSGSVGGPSQGIPEHSMAQEVEALLRTSESNEKDQAKQMALHLKFKAVPQGTMIELVDGNDNFMFPVGAAGLKPAAVELLQKLALIFSKLRNKLEIHGHTDGRPYEPGAKQSNWDLSFDRANEARRILENAGVPPGRIISVQAHADTQLLNKKDPLAPENRRLSLLILQDKSKRRASASSDADKAKIEPAKDDNR